MDDVIIKILKKPDLKDPILIEGLPGVGNVGKLAADHLKDELKAKKFADVYSKHFPPQVLVDDDGITRLVNNELFYYKSGGKFDLIFLLGDYQGLTPEGQYQLTMKLLETVKGFGVKKIFTLGGYGQGKMVETPRVLGAATNLKLVKEMKKHGVVFSKGEPGSGIVGASGLLLGLGKAMEMEGVCLMGETSGYFVDPKSAEAVIKILMTVLDVKIDLTKLEDKAKQIDQITSKLKEMENKSIDAGKEVLGYIG